MRFLPFFAILLTLEAAADPAPGTSTAATGTCLGEAFHLDANAEGGVGVPAMVYSEEHQQRFEGGRLIFMRTIYRHGAEKILAERTLDFGASPTRPGYTLKDLRTGREEGASVSEGSVLVYNRASRDNPRKQKTIKVPGPFVIDGGFHPFPLENWDILSKGEKIHFHFLVPSRLDFFRFQAYMDPKGQDKEGKERVFVAVPESRVLRFLVEPIRVRYDVSSRKMKEYRGLSNIDGADGKSMKVRLVYRDPGL